MFTRLSSSYNSLALRPIDIHIIASACQVSSIRVGHVLQLQAEWQIHVESLLGLSHARKSSSCAFLTTFVTNALIY